MFLNDYIGYWQTLVSNHMFIKQFYRWNADEVNDALKTKMEYPILILNEYDGEVKQSGTTRNFLEYQKGSFMILDKIKVQNYDDEQTRLNALKEYGFGILAKIFDDVDAENCPAFMLGIQPDSINFFLTNFKLEHCRGWLFEFTIKQKADDFIVNPDHWKP